MAKLKYHVLKKLKKLITWMDEKTAEKYAYIPSEAKE